MISDSNFWYINGLMALVAILIYGQGLNEYKVSPEDNCTRHRYEVFARNYFHSFGVGLGFYLSLQVAVQSVYYTTGIKNYYVQDALANLIMQFGIVSMLAYNDPLPGHLDIWDFFSPFREFTAGVVAFLQRRLTPNLDVKNSRDSLLASVFSQLSSRKFRYILDLILSGGNYFPRRELLSWGAWREDRMITQDPRRIIFDNKAFKQFYGMFKSDVEVAIQKIKIAHYCSTWVAQPMLTAIHIVGGVIALIVDVLQIMKDECLDDIMKSNKLDELLLFYRDELKKDEVNVAIYSQHGEEKSAEVSPDVPVVLPTRLDSPRTLCLKINPHYLDVPDEQERVILHSPAASAEVKDDFIKDEGDSDPEEDGIVVAVPVRRSSLVDNGLWGLRKLDNVMRQLKEGQLNVPHQTSAVVYRK
jgi:hypothetical protein